MKRILILMLCLLSLGMSQHALALFITVDATGNSSSNTENFWGFNFQKGSGFIRSISFDLTPINKYFDLDGRGNFRRSSEVVISNNSTLTGDGSVGESITAEYTKQRRNNRNRLVRRNYHELSLIFNQGTCGQGCNVRFSTDTDPGTDSGADHAGATFRIVFEDGRVFSGTLRANAGATPSQSLGIVPLPAAAWLFLSALGMGGLVGMRSRRTSTGPKADDDLIDVGTNNSSLLLTSAHQ